MHISYINMYTCMDGIYNECDYIFYTSSIIGVKTIIKGIEYFIDFNIANEICQKYICLQKLDVKKRRRKKSSIRKQMPYSTGFFLDGNTF